MIKEPKLLTIQRVQRRPSKAQIGAFQGVLSGFVEDAMGDLSERHLTQTVWEPRENRPDLIIFGGESGPKARPCNWKWIRDGVRQCRDAGVSAFVKQLGTKQFFCDEQHDGGAANYGKRVSCRGEVCDQVVTTGKGADPDEWPEVLRVRQFPDE